MKSSSSLFSTFGVSILASLLVFPAVADAKGSKKSSHGHSSNHGKDQNHGDSDRGRQAYSALPRSSFVLSLGNGYAGRGYYYGPPNSTYYYNRSDVRYYATREAAPREYHDDGGARGDSTDMSVQRELARRGFYRGSVDGAMGPQSRQAIVNYQRDQGLRETGFVTGELLQSLGLR